MEMSTAVEKVLAIYELTEQILLHLHDNLGLIRAQRVCRSWRDIITTSPALRAACWYPPQLPSRSKSCNEDKISNPASIPPFSDDYNSPEEQYWLLNPAFAKLGFEIGLDQFPDITFQEEGSFDLRQRIYDTPGSWTTMLATNPPSKMMIIECYGDYSDDEIMWYLLVSRNPPGLLMGEVLASLAEAQNRQERGIDRWAGVHHYTGALRRWSPNGWEKNADWQVLRDMPADVDVSVAVSMPWGCDDAPAFSLRRIPLDVDRDLLRRGEGFLCEMVVHAMITGQGTEWEWYGWREGGWMPGKPVCRSKEPYRMNLVVVGEHPEWYRVKCNHTYRLLADVKSGRESHLGQ